LYILINKAFPLINILNSHTIIVYLKEKKKYRLLKRKRKNCKKTTKI